MKFYQVILVIFVIDFLLNEKKIKKLQNEFSIFKIKDRFHETSGL